MKFVCYKEFDDPEEPTFPGVLYQDKILPLAKVIAVAEACHPRGLSVPDSLDVLVSQLSDYVTAFKELEKKKLLDQIWPEIGVSLTAPIPRPSRILAIGRNYAEHAKETGSDVPEEPIVFQKSSTSVIGPEQPVVVPEGIGRVDYEGELAVVIGKRGHSVAEAEAMRLVAGYTLINDVTARDDQKRAIACGLPWFLSKSYDTFGPLGPCIVTADEIKNPAGLEITLAVNGEVKQRAKISEMVFSIPKLIAYVSRRIALFPGDIIATGTPPGIGAINPGDTMEVRIAEIGTLSNPVIGEGSLL